MDMLSYLPIYSQIVCFHGEDFLWFFFKLVSIPFEMYLCGGHNYHFLNNGSNQYP